MPQTGQEATSTHKLESKCPENISETCYKCVVLNARSLVNKNNELNNLVEDIKHHIIRECIRLSFVETTSNIFSPLVGSITC